MFESFPVVVVLLIFEVEGPGLLGLVFDGLMDLSCEAKQFPIPQESLMLLLLLLLPLSLSKTKVESNPLSLSKTKLESNPLSLSKEGEKRGKRKEKEGEEQSREVEC